MIADLCIKHDLLCFSDEVYEWLTYDGAKHVKIGEKHPQLSTIETRWNGLSPAVCFPDSQPPWDVGTNGNSGKRRENLQCYWLEGSKPDAFTFSQCF